ncbi:MAG TPA: DUF3095 domain-containing protein [Aestuariivirgaceae bacterium]
MLQTVSDNFFVSIPPFTRFSEVADAAHYRRLPDDWIVGVADVVDSTGAIARGKYKAVNMVGASVISAVLNKLGHRDFPFAFGGDGAAFAVPGQTEAQMRDVGAELQVWAAEEMGLSLRVALVPLHEIRRAGHDVTVARFAVAPELFYAMFSGGGLNWAEAQMKAGNYLIAPAAPGSRPDLAGLSCRWQPINAERGEIVSVLVVPQAKSRDADFTKLVGDVTAALGDGARPVSANTLQFSWSPRGLKYEVLAAHGRSSFILRYLKLALFVMFGWLIFRFNVTVGGFNPQRYRADTARNSDFRKFDDGLKLTLDLDAVRLERLTRMLEDAKQRGIAYYGLHRQAQALMTCIVPSPLLRDHLHFIDGAGGGYAKAAEGLKLQMRG